MGKTISANWIAEHSPSEWLANDPRSAIAMIRGNGDGREVLYNRFCEHHKSTTPGTTDEDLVEGFAQYGLKMEAKLAAERRQRSNAQGFNSVCLAGAANYLNILKIRIRLWMQKNL